MDDSGSKKGGGSPSGDQGGERSAEKGRDKSGGTTGSTTDSRSVHPSPESQGLYFFPDAEVTDDELRKLLAKGTREERAWAISHLLRYAQWGDIWTYVSRDEVREIFPELDLPPNLRSAWGRMLKVETPVG